MKKNCQAVVDRSPEILAGKSFYVIINLDLTTGKEIEKELLVNGKPTDEMLDKICKLLPYFPTSFLKENAKYTVELNPKENQSRLYFMIYLFSPRTFLETMSKIDELTGGFPIVTMQDKGMFEIVDPEEGTYEK
jgi:hypothetical protein